METSVLQLVVTNTSQWINLLFIDSRPLNNFTLIYDEFNRKWIGKRKDKKADKKIVKITRTIPEVEVVRENPNLRVTSLDHTLKCLVDKVERL